MASPSLSGRDPKKYPLASIPLPQHLQRLVAEYNGQNILGEDGKDAVSSHDKPNVLADALVDPTNRLSSSGPVHSDTIKHHMSMTSSARKRSQSPGGVSLTEAAEIASLQRRNKRPRPSLHKLRSFLDQDIPAPSAGRLHPPASCSGAPGPVTPDTENGNTAQFKIPQQRSRNQTSLTGTPSAQLGEFATFSPPHNEAAANVGSSQDATMPLLTSDVPPSGVSATPPVAEADMEPVAVAGAETSTAPLRPHPIQTAHLQDASLPSPSLSPITAAANLHSAFGGSPDISSIDDDSTDASGLGIISGSYESIDSSLNTFTIQTFDPPARQDATDSDEQLLTPSMLDIPHMFDAFDVMPDDVKTQVMFQLLRRCPKTTLHVVAEIVNPALKCDFLSLLPLELSLNVLQHLDKEDRCRGAQVSKRWRLIINSDEKGWKDMFDRDGFVLPEGELERAVREGWGWQYPHGPASYERDLSSAGDPTTPPRQVMGSLSDLGDSDGPSNTSNRPKRKATKITSSKAKKRKVVTTTKARAPSWAHCLEDGKGPITYSNAAARAVSNPQVGLPSLRNLHLFKTLYQRHDLIRRSWMDQSTRPQHIAFRAHQRHVVTCLQFDTDKILTGSDDTNINVYDTKTGALRTRLEGHEGGVWALQYEGNTLVSGSTDRSVRVWDIEQGKCTQMFQGHTSTVRCLVILKPTVIGREADGSPIIMPKEPLIITGSRDSSLRIWKLPQPGDETFYQTAIPADEHVNPYFVRTLNGHIQSVRAIAAHGDTLVSGSYDTYVRAWSISTGDLIHRLAGHASKVYSVVLDHERNRCISGSMDNLVKVWSLETGNCLFNLEGHSSLVGLLDLGFSRLVSAAADSTLRIWDPDSGQCKSTLTAHTGAITCFQHDGQKVISGSDRTLKMWNVKTGECVKDLLTELSGVWQVKFNDRRCVAAVQRNQLTYIEVLDFGAARDGVPADQLGRRIVVDTRGKEVDDGSSNDDTN